MEAVAIDYQVLTPLFNQAFAFASTLVVRLESEDELHVLEVRERINRLIADLEAEAEQLNQGDAFDELKPLVLGLLQDVVRFSNWSHITRCAFCKWEVREMILPPGLLLEASELVSGQAREGEEVQGKAMVLLHALAMTQREPYFVERWRKQQREMLRLAEPELSAESFASALLSPELSPPLRLNAIDLQMPAESVQNPLGRVGAAWREMEDFCERYKINPAQQSWYLLLGLRNAGKTALLRTPEADFAAIGDKPSEGASTNVRWHYKSDGHMVLDVPGRMIADDAEASDRAQWLHLLDLLRTHRPKKPINGIILTVELASVLVSENGAQELASRLRGVLQLAARKLKMRPPVYVVFTRCDHLFGFAEFGMALDAKRRKELIGLTPSGELGDPFRKQDFVDRYWKLTQHLAKIAPHLLAEVSTPREAAGVYGMSLEFGALSTSLGEFMESLMLSLGDKPQYLFRGAYFTAAHPKGYETVRELAFVPPEEKAGRPLEGEVLGLSLFTSDLFGERIFAERNAFLPRFEISGDLDEERSYLDTIKFPWRSFFRFMCGGALLVLLIWFVYTWWTLSHLRGQTAVVNGVPIHFILIPGKTFAMGSPGSDPLRFSDEHQHQVKLDHFYASTFEVSQRQWSAVMDVNPSFYDCGMNCPVQNISFADAQVFLAKLNEVYAESKPAGSFALLQEAEWEYAARAGSSEQFPGILGPGTSSPNPDQAALQAWYIMNPAEVQERKPQAVGLLQPNAFGLFDMAGNVAEWVDDVYGPYPGAQVADLLRQEPDLHILRGGSFFLEFRNIRPASRGPFEADYQDRDTGLRLKWVPAPDSEQGRYLSEHPWLVTQYFATLDWFASNGEMVASWGESLGGWTGDLVKFFVGEEKPKAPADAPAAAAAPEPAPEASK